MSHAGTGLGEHTVIANDRFVIRAKLGSGGMGEVYLAEDTLLKRSVAIKLIRREHDHDSAYEHRLRLEAERASQLNHPHIAAVYDLLEQAGRLCLVMEYVEGQTLRSKLRENISSEEFFAIAGQCLDAIAAAHRRGVLHCDLKPENIIVSPQGDLKVLDFGVARAFTDNHTIDELTTTSLGGTPGYMAPEVLLGAAPGRCSDIFSVGVIFYEMLSRQHPFRLDREAPLASGILRSGPPPLPKGVPEGIEPVILRMLAKDPEQRYQRCEDTLTDIRAVQSGKKPRLGETRSLLNRFWMRGVFAAILVVALLVPTRYLRMPWQAGQVQAAVRELAVLPFQPTAQDSGSRAFALGLTETLAARLGEIADRYPVEVVPAAEVRAQSVSDARHARSLLGASLVLEGSFQQSGSTVRILYSLVDTRSLRQLHSGVITVESSDTFAVQDRVIEEVLKMLDIELAQSDRGLMGAHGTADPQAYDSYLRGRGYLQQYDRTESLQNAIAEFRHSLAADPQFGAAYAGLGQAYLHLYSITHAPGSLSSATEACKSAAELNKGNPDGEICLGMLANASGKFETAAEHLEHALKLDSSRPDIYQQLAIAYEKDKRGADAELLLKREIALRPESYDGYQALGWFYSQHGRYDEAALQFKRVIEIAPDSIMGYSNLGATLVLQGNYSEAIDALERSIRIQPTAPALNNLGAVYFYLRKYPESASAYQRAARMTPDDYTVFGNLGEAYAQMPARQEESRQAYMQALRLARQRLQASPKDGDALLSAALFAASLGKSEEAEPYRRAGVKASGQNPETRFISAQVLARLHQDAKALAELERALHLGLPLSEVSGDPEWQRFSGDPKYQAMTIQKNNH